VGVRIARCSARVRVCCVLTSFWESGLGGYACAAFVAALQMRALCHIKFGYFSMSHAPPSKLIVFIIAAPRPSVVLSSLQYAICLCHCSFPTNTTPSPLPPSASLPPGSTGPSAPFTGVASHLVQLVSVNLRRLVLSNVHPSEVGVFIGPASEGQSLTLAPLHTTLQVRGALIRAWLSVVLLRHVPMNAHCMCPHARSVARVAYPSTLLCFGHKLHIFVCASVRVELSPLAHVMCTPCPSSHVSPSPHLPIFRTDNH
jgi:hypothetical protein